MSCISRRAHADRYSFKLYKEDNGEIKERNYIWTEYRCPNEALEGKETCAGCSLKKDADKYQSSARFDQGIVGGPYTQKSKLYGSQYYLKFIKEGWKIREGDEKRAKEAQQKASMPPAKKKIDESGTPLTIKTKDPKSSNSLASQETPKVTPKLTPKSPRKIRLAKKPLPETSSQAEFVESLQPLTSVSEVLVVKVKKIRCSGTEYYYDSQSGKLYGVSVKGVGAYKGRYNPEDETINTDYPDSDEE